MTHNSLQLQLQTDLDLISKDVPSQRVLELDVRAPQVAPRADRSKLNLALVIDRSGSMSGHKLEYVKTATLHVLDLLQEQDRAAIITYDDQIEVLSESVHLTPENRAEIKRKVRTLQPGNITYLSGGWLRGCQEVAQHVAEDQLNRALLLTDGLANMGITDSEELGRHAHELKARGVSTSTFGVGEGFDHHLLEHMSNRGGGNFYFIAHPTEVPNIFLRELHELSTITAKDVEIILEIPQHVSLELLGDWRCEHHAGRLHIFLGDLVSGHLQEVYLKLLTPPADGQSELTIQASLRGRGEGGLVYQEKAELTFRYAEQDLVQAAPRNKDVQERFSGVEVANTANEALKLERQGRHREAQALLRRDLRANAPHLNQEQVNYYQDLSDKMDDSLSEKDRKSSHYRSYLDKRRREQ